MRSIRPLAFVLGACVALNAAALDLRFDARDLGTLPGRQAQPTAINAVGQVVGKAFDPVAGDYTAFATGPDGVGLSNPCPAGFPDCLAQGIDDVGRVAVTMLVSDDTGPIGQRSALVDVDGANAVTLGTFGFDVNTVNGLSRNGLVTGSAVDATAHLARAYFARQRGQKLHELGTLGQWASGLAINSRGVVVGFSALADGRNSHAFVALPDGSALQDLGTFNDPANGPFGFDRDDSAALAISNNGLVVGWAATPDGRAHAFVARAGQPGLRDLGTLGHRGDSQATSVNSRGWIVGYSNEPSSDRNFRTFIARAQDGKMFDLNNFVEMPAGVKLIGPAFINERGQVAAYASDFHTYLLTPR